MMSKKVIGILTAVAVVSLIFVGSVAAVNTVVTSDSDSLYTLNNNEANCTWDATHGTESDYSDAIVHFYGNISDANTNTDSNYKVNNADSNYKVNQIDPNDANTNSNGVFIITSRNTQADVADSINTLSAKVNSINNILSANSLTTTPRTVRAIQMTNTLNSSQLHSNNTQVGTAQLYHNTHLANINNLMNTNAVTDLNAKLLNLNNALITLNSSLLNNTSDCYRTNLASLRSDLADLTSNYTSQTNSNWSPIIGTGLMTTDANSNFKTNDSDSCVNLDSNNSGSCVNWRWDNSDSCVNLDSNNSGSCVNWRWNNSDSCVNLDCNNSNSLYSDLTRNTNC